MTDGGGLLAMRLRRCLSAPCLRAQAGVVGGGATGAIACGEGSKESLRENVGNGVVEGP